MSSLRDFTANFNPGTLRESRCVEMKLLLVIFDLCIAEANEGDPQEVCNAYELLLALLHDIDHFERDELVFWGDEPGTWQLGIDWACVIPPYLRCLAKVHCPEEFADKASALIGQLKPLNAAKLRLWVADLTRT